MKKIVVLGAGESGTGAALLAHAKGYQVFVSDKNTITSPYKEQLVAYGIPFEEGTHTWESIQDADEIIKSPGISNNTPIIQAVKQAGIPMIDEIEFASRYTDAVLIGITGSNGKSTTTHLTYHLLHAAGLDVGIAGNMGESFAKKVWQEPNAYYVLEISNFQLEYLNKCKMHIACLLNITPDHLDQYNYQMDGYIAAKWRIIRNMDRNDHFIYNQDDPHIMNYLPQHQVIPQHHPISLTKAMNNGACLQETTLYFAGNEYNFQVPTRAVPLPGKHNLSNTMMAISVAVLLGIKPQVILAGLQNFQGLPHRMELVAEVDEVKFYNDSKATNVESAAVALESFTQPIVWIAGGYDKGNDYMLLQSIVKEHVKALICLGKKNAPIWQAFSHLSVPIYETRSIQEAVQIAHTLAKPQEIVLLSPACASFDLFKNFEDRGQQFKDAVRRLLTPHNQLKG